MQNDSIRLNTERVLHRHGLAVPPHLPVPGSDELRPPGEIVERLFCLYAVAAAAHGFSPKRALEWLSRENLESGLTSLERRFLERNEGNPNAFKVQVEAMWALAWTLGMVTKLDFWRPCSSSFVTLLPNLNVDETIDRTLAMVKAEGGKAVVAARDLSYCLHWLVHETLLNNRAMPKGLQPYVIIERRRALEWVLSGDQWDDVSLDT